MRGWTILIKASILWSIVGACFIIFNFFLASGNNRASPFTSHQPDQTPSTLLNADEVDVPVFQFLDSSGECRIGIPNPTLSSLYQAALHNKRVYLFSNCFGSAYALEQLQNGSDIWKRVTVIEFEQYANTQPILNYKQLFYSRKIAGKDDQLWRFELLCIVRWMILLNFMKEQNIHQAAFTDSDALLYTNMTQFVLSLTESVQQNQKTGYMLRCGLLLDPPRAAGSFIIIDQQCLTEYIDIGEEENRNRSRTETRPMNDMALFIHYYLHATFSQLPTLPQNPQIIANTICTTPEKKDYCFQLVKTYHKMYTGTSSEQKKPLTIMESISNVRRFSVPIFHSEHIPETVVESVYDPVRNTTIRYSRYYGEFDMNYSGGSQWVMSGNYKRVVWIRGYPYVQRKNMDFLVAALGLHFQGRKKPLAVNHIQHHLRHSYNDDVEDTACTVDISQREYCSTHR